MKLYFAPLEGINGPQYRRIHHKHFSGVDKYYAPFISPTCDHLFTPKELRNLAPEHNIGIPLVPQLMSKNPEDVLWASGELFQMGYDEVNLNLGCPSGTVVAKGKGAGMLSDPEWLNEFLYQVFRKAEGNISVKTRLGMTDPEEFHRLLQIFSRYPISLLIIHPRVRSDFYKNPVKPEYFEQALICYEGPVCYNGGLYTSDSVRDFSSAHPSVEQIMLGQGLIANPALAQQSKGLGELKRETLQTFHDELFHEYLDVFHSARNTVYHMKELWFYMGRLFDGGEKLFKQIKKAQDTAAYESAVREIFRTLPMNQDVLWK